MGQWVEAIAGLWFAYMFVKIIVAAVLGGLYEWRSWRALVRLVDRWRPDRDPGPREPIHRPIEAIGTDLRRIRAGFHHENMRFAQYEGRRLAYDRVLAEACDSLEVPHLIGLLRAGDELDHERERVERVLARAGLIENTAA